MYTVRKGNQDIQVADLPTLAAKVKAGEFAPDAAAYENATGEWTTVGAIIAPPSPAKTTPAPSAVTPPSEKVKGGGVGVFLLVVTLACAVALAASGSGEIGVLALLFVLVSAVWVRRDAAKHQLAQLSASSDKSLKFIDRLSPTTWQFLTILLWLVVFPLYLFKRKKLIRAARATKQAA